LKLRSLRTSEVVGLIAGTVGLAGLIVLLLSPLHLAGAVILLVGVAVGCIAMPSAGLWLVLLLFAIHPLAMKVAEVNFSVTGTSLLLFSAWKEVALGSVLAARLAGVALDRWRCRRIHVALAPMDYLAGALVILVGAGLGLRPDSLALNYARLLLFPIGVYVALRLGPVDAQRYLRLAVAVAAGVSVLAIVQGSFFGFSFVTTYWGEPGLPIPGTFIAQYLDGPRASGTFGSPNELGFALAVWALMSAALIVVSPRGRRWLTAALLAILVALSLTFSRSAIFAVMAGVAVLVVVSWRASVPTRRGWAYLGLAILPALVLSGSVYVARGGTELLASTISTLSSVTAADTGLAAPTPKPSPSGSLGPTPSPTGLETNPSAGAHLSSLSSGWALVREHPMGLGLGAVGSRADPLTSDRPRYIIESWYLTMGASLGWLGLMWATVVPVAMFVTGLSSARRGSIAVGLALTSVAVAIGIISYWLPTMMQPQMAMLPWSLAALALVSVTPAPA
jgi:O-Antigen ligase